MLSDAFGNCSEEQSRSAPILHVDMDAFFASVEVLDRPELAGTPVIVGMPGGRSVVTAATYEARALGVHAAMPMAKAMRLAPDAVVIPPHSSKYSKASAGVMAVLGSVTPAVEQVSIDEAFLDVAGAYRRLGSPLAIARLIKQRIMAEQGLACTVGLAATKSVAKIASTRGKPNGILPVPKDRTQEFLDPLPVSSLWGVGAKTEATLTRLGLRTVEDIRSVGVRVLSKALGQAAGRHIFDLAHGIDDRGIEVTRTEKSIGSERTYSTDVCEVEDIERDIMRLASSVSSQVRTQGYASGCITLKIRYHDFRTETRSHTLFQPSHSTQDLTKAAVSLLHTKPLKAPWVRLIGVRCEKLVDADNVDIQLQLGERDKGWREADAAIDQARAKYGETSLTRASLLHQERPSPGRSTK